MAAKADLANAPRNFSWVVNEALCGCECPKTKANLNFLKGQRVDHLVTLSGETLPHSCAKRLFSHHILPVEEFEAPSVDQMEKFTQICAQARKNNKVVCIHCRMGRGRTGVMAACYLVKFYHQIPQSAITNVRLMRPGSIETWEQERAIRDFWDHLGRTLDE